MSGELKLSQFKYTVTADNDFVIGSPLDAGLHTDKFLVFQVSSVVGPANNPHVLCSYSDITHDWRLKFSNDGSTINEFVLSDADNTFTKTNTFTLDTIFNGPTSFTAPATFTSTIEVSAANLTISGLIPSKVLITDSNTKLTSSDITTTELDSLSGIDSNIQDQLNTKAPLLSPALTGTPTTTTPAINDNSNRIANTSYVNSFMTAINSSLYSYDGRAIIMTDMDGSGNSYRLKISDGVLAVEPYFLPGGSHFVLDAKTSLGALVKKKFFFSNGVLTVEDSLVDGPFFYSLFDSSSMTYHKLYFDADSGTLRTQPE